MDAACVRLKVHTVYTNEQTESACIWLERYNVNHGWNFVIKLLVVSTMCVLCHINGMREK